MVFTILKYFEQNDKSYGEIFERKMAIRKTN